MSLPKLGIIKKLKGKDLKFDKEEISELNPLFWAAYPEPSEKLNPKNTLYLSLIVVYMSKMGINLQI
jgi:hypothetical protein